MGWTKFRWHNLQVLAIMKAFLWLACLINAQIVGGQWSKDVSNFDVEENVLILSENNFDEALAKYAPIMINFYHPQCQFSASLKSVWEEAATELKWALSAVTLAKFNVRTSDMIADKYNITGTPTILLFRDGIPSRYTGGHKVGDIVMWANKKTGPPYVVLITVDELIKFQEKHDPFALGVYNDLRSEHAVKLMEMSYVYDDQPQIAITSSIHIKEHLQVQKDSLLVLKSFETKRQDLSIQGEPWDLQRIRTWLDRKSPRLSHVYNTTTAKKLFSHEVKKHVLLFTDTSQPFHEIAMEALYPIAEDYLGKALFLIVDKQTETRTFTYFAPYFSELPAIVVADMETFPTRMPKYPLGAAVGEGNSEVGKQLGLDLLRLHTLIGEVVDGTANQTFKSQPLLPQDTEGTTLSILS